MRWNCLKLRVQSIEEALSLIDRFDSNEIIDYLTEIKLLGFSKLHLNGQLLRDHIFYTQPMKCFESYPGYESLSKFHRILQTQSLSSLFSLWCRNRLQRRIQFCGFF